MVMEIAYKNKSIKYNYAFDVKEYAKERLLVDLLNFFSQRPYDKFTLEKVAHNLKFTSLSDIERTLKLLVKNRLVNKELTCRGLHFCALSSITTIP